MRTPALIIAATIAAILTSACSLVQRPQIRSVRPRITGLDCNAVSLAFDVDVSNPYPVALRAPGFQYAVDIEDAELCKSDAPVEVAIPAGQVGTATLPLRLVYADIVRAQQRLSDAAEVQYRLRGTVPVTALGQSYELPLSHSGTFPMFRIPAVSVEHIECSELSLTSAKVTVDVSVRNPNVFALGMQHLGYALYLGDKSCGSLTASTTTPIAAGATGTLKISGEISTGMTVLRILQGGGVHDARVSPTGKIDTPYGAIDLSG